MKTISAFRFCLWRCHLSAFAILASGFWLLASAHATTVEFPLQQMFGTTNYTKSFKLQAAQTFVTDGTNAWIGSDQTVTPSGGTNPIVSVTPNDYLVKFSDAVYPWKIRVPNTTNKLNALYLTLGPLPTFLVELNPHRTATNVDNATGTNVNLSGIVSGTFSGDVNVGASKSIKTYGSYYTITGVTVGQNTTWTTNEILDAFGNFYGGAITASSLDTTGTITAMPDGTYVDAIRIYPASGSELRSIGFPNSESGWGISTEGDNTPLTFYNGSTTAVLSISPSGIISGNGSGMTNLQPSNIAGGWTGIVTNWGTGMGVNSNRQYFSFGIVTNVTRP